MVKYINQSFEILTSINAELLKLVEIAGRTCYKSEKFYDDLEAY